MKRKVFAFVKVLISIVEYLDIEDLFLKTGVAYPWFRMNMREDHLNLIKISSYNCGNVVDKLQKPVLIRLRTPKHRFLGNNATLA